MEMPSGKVVGIKPIDPRTPGSFAEGLQETMAAPAEGPRRKPARIRVPNAELAESLRAAVGKEIEIGVAPVPELDELVASLAEHLQTRGEEPAYLDGIMAPEVVGSLFTAAARLFALAPWRHVAEDQVLRVDIPSLDIDGAALCIIGGTGQDFGILLFRSLRDYEEFSITADGVNRNPAAPAVVTQWSLLSLSFNRKRDTPPRMLEEIAHHRWPVAGSKAYPLVMAIASDATPTVFTERDYRIMTVCARAFIDFLTKHRSMFAEEHPEIIREAFTTEADVTVTLTAPYAQPRKLSASDFIAGRFDPLVVAPSDQHLSAGRNDPCPCGSGKKYKKCHLDAHRAPHAVPAEGESVHDMDFRLVRSIVRFAVDRYGDHWLNVLEDGIGTDEAAMQLFMPWAAWTADVDRKRIAETFLEQNGARLSDEERAWLASQLTAWLSFWEVTHVEPGRTDVHDLLTGERRSVNEVMASKSLITRDTLLARVVDFRGTSYFGGMYGRCLSPREASDVIATVRGKLRIRKGNIPIERLRDAVAGRQMIHWWSDAIARLDDHRSKPPVLTNTDGDPLLFVTDSFPFDGKLRREIEQRVGAMDGVDDVSTEDGETIAVFVRSGNRIHKSWENTVTGRVIVARDTLRIETNSESRADALRRRVRDACAGLLGEGARKTQGAAEMMRREKGRPSAEKRKSPAPYELEALRQAKEAHYRDWLDTPIPLLGGKTPRAATRAKKSREQLDLLLRDIENREGRLPEGERLDVDRLRTALGMDE
ncbi:MAG: YecA family protein [Thermoanaerobaculia bacterium]